MNWNILIVTMSMEDVLAQLRNLVSGQQSLQKDISALATRVATLETGQPASGHAQRDSAKVAPTDSQALLDFGNKLVSELSVEQLCQIISSQPQHVRADKTGVVQADSLSQAGLAEPEDTQGDFRVIQDAYSKVRLPSDLKFSGSQKGLKPESREATGILSMMARYTETCLKILQDIAAHSGNTEYAVNTHLDKILTYLVAQLRFLQEEQNALFVQGSFGKKTHALFRQFKWNTSTLG